MMPALVAISFDLLRAIAAAHAPTLVRLADPGLLARLADPAFGEPWRAAARAWDVDGKRSVRARTDGGRGLVRFGGGDGEGLLLVYAMAPRIQLVDLVRMPDADFEAFGQLV